MEFVFFHPNSFIEADGVFVGVREYNDFLFTPCEIVGNFHHGFSKSLFFIGSIDAEVCDQEPVDKVGQSKTNANDLGPSIPGYQADLNVPDKVRDSLPKILLGILFAKVAASQEIDVFVSIHIFRPH